MEKLIVHAKIFEKKWLDRVGQSFTSRFLSRPHGVKEKRLV